MEKSEISARSAGIELPRASGARYIAPGNLSPRESASGRSNGKCVAQLGNACSGEIQSMYVTSNHVGGIKRTRIEHDSAAVHNWLADVRARVDWRKRRAAVLGSTEYLCVRIWAR